MNPLIEGFKGAIRLPDRRPPWQWMEEFVDVDDTSPMPGRWRSDNSPWVKEITEEFGETIVTDISVMCSAQSSKTQTFINLLLWAVSEAPGPCMWVTAARDEAKEFVADRLIPSIYKCGPAAARLIPDRYAIKKLNISFTSMPVYITGAGSKSKLQSKPIRYLFLDEVRNYKPGALETALKRTRSFHNAKRVLISTPGKEKDPVHRAYLAGDQRVFHFACPKCGQLQPLRFEQLKWDTNEKTKPDGKWDLDVLAETIRYACIGCGHEMRDFPEVRKAIARSGKFIRMNPRAPRHRVSFHWNALLPTWVRWRDIVEEFIAAKAALTTGDTSPMYTFVTETLGEPWEDRLGEIEDYDFLNERQGDYDFGDPWPEEVVRFMSADKQAAGGEHYWYVIRAFAWSGKSRLISYGRCESYEELLKIAADNKVNSLNCMIDASFKMSEVIRFCAVHGWKPFRGDDHEFFNVRDRKTQKMVRRFYQRVFADPNLGMQRGKRIRSKPIPVFIWSNPSIKDTLTEQMAGLLGDWTIPRKVGHEYYRQITAERREEKEDSLGRVKYVWKAVRKDNHLRDCELMITAAALITRNLQSLKLQVDVSAEVNDGSEDTGPGVPASCDLGGSGGEPNENA